MISDHLDDLILSFSDLKSGFALVLTNASIRHFVAAGVQLTEPSFSLWTLLTWGAINCHFGGFVFNRDINHRSRDFVLIQLRVRKYRLSLAITCQKLTLSE